MMPEFPNGGLRYRIEWSGYVIEELKQLQRRAAREGRGEEMLSAFRIMTERLQIDPFEVGEPMYRLPALRMQVRSVAIRPLHVVFAVCEDRPVVFLGLAKLLSGPAS